MKASRPVVRLPTNRSFCRRARTGIDQGHGWNASLPLIYCWLLIGLWLFAEAGASAYPSSYPKRKIGNYFVDLTPLITWWQAPHGIRPLTSWKHVQGIFEQEVGLGWMIRGKIEGISGTQVFIVKNPPVERLRRYRELKEALPRLQQARASTLEVASLPAYTGWHWTYVGLQRTPNQDFERVEQAKLQLQELDHNLGLARDEWANLADKDGNFKIDGFALRLNETYQGKLLFDAGIQNNVL